MPKKKTKTRAGNKRKGKLKTKSSVKRRMKVTAKGKIAFKRCNKQHCMSKRSKRQIRVNRKTGFFTTRGLVKFIKRAFLRISNKK